VDFDADGNLDVVSGSYSPGDLFVFRKQSNGTYAKPQTILDAKDKPVNVGAAAHAQLVDWDNDNDLDLFVGNIQGEVWYVPNEGTREKPAYGEKRPVMADGKRVTCGGGDAGPAVADWDGDARLDLLVGGGDGAVMFYRNTSDDKSQPTLAAGQVLVPSSSMTRAQPGANGAAVTRHGMRAKLHVVDYNGDGKPDLLLGDFSSSEVKPEQTEDQRAKQQQAESKLTDLHVQQQKLAVAPDGETPEQRKERQKALRNVQREIINESRTAMAAAQPKRWENHGYVWLYLRKDAGRTAGAQGGGG
jgi:hypothetical protein